MKDVIMLVAENDGEGHFAMKVFGSILEVTNNGIVDITANVKFKWYTNSKYFDTNRVSFDASASTYNSWGNNIDASAMRPITLSKNATTYVYIPVYDIQSGSTNYSVGLSAEDDEINECSIVPFKTNPGNAKLFKMTLNLGKGSAKAIIREFFKEDRIVDVNWVQLWKNGPKFAEYNVGVTNGKVESSGGYYKWGANLYDVDYNEGEDPLSGTYDTATYMWGDAWRMPTQAEFLALLENCDVEWTIVNGEDGRKFTGKGNYASNSVFFPAAGYYDDRYGDKYYPTTGFYWASTPDGSSTAYQLRFRSDIQDVIVDSRQDRNSVRAVLAE